MSGFSAVISHSSGKARKPTNSTDAGRVTADSAEQLAQTLNRLQHAESVSEGALKTYQENFTAEANYRQLMAIYSKAMQKSGERNEPSCG